MGLFSRIFGPIGILLMSAVVEAFPSTKHLAPHAPCGDVKGTITIDQLQLYPENADFDFHACLLYIGYVSSSFITHRAVYQPLSTDFSFTRALQGPLQRVSSGL